MTPAVEERKQDRAPTNGTVKPNKKPSIGTHSFFELWRGSCQAVPALCNTRRHIQRLTRHQFADDPQHRWQVGQDHR